MRFFKKFKKFERGHKHELALMSGVLAVLIVAMVFSNSWVPRIAEAWIIYVYPVTHTPVQTGGNTTISWQAPTADYCTITGPGLPCQTVSIGGLWSWTVCGKTVNGPYGSAEAGPINGPSAYNIACTNVDDGGGGGDGQNSITVVPTPANTTLTGFTANPTSVNGSGTSNLSWGGTKGTKFSSCQLTGGQWGTAGAWFTALPGSTQTQTITETTTYSFRCVDTDGASTPTRTATVTVNDACSNIPGNQAAAPTNGTASGGTCSCNAGYVLSGDQCVGADVCSNIAGTQTSAPANGTANANGTCSCNSGYTLSGGSCVAACSGAHQVGTPPNCTCETGYTMQGGTCVAAQCPGANEGNWPTCSCNAGFSRDTATNMCIREPQLSITVNGQASTRVRRGNTVSLVWSATGVTVGSCRVTTNTGATVGSQDSGSITPAVANQTTYRLGCTNEAGAPVSREANVTIIPSVIEQ